MSSRILLMEAQMKLQEFIDLKDTCPECNSDLILRLTDCTNPVQPIHMNVDNLIGMCIIKCHHKNLSVFIHLNKNRYVYSNKEYVQVVLNIDILCRKNTRHYLRHAEPFTLILPTEKWLDLPSIELESA